MKFERVFILLLAVMAALSLVMASLVTAERTAAAGPVAQKEEPAPQRRAGDPGIVLTKTVGLDPGDCADDKTIAVAPGTRAVYCYEVENIGGIALSQHDLTDSELGSILAAFSFDLQPNARAFLTQSAVITTPTVNTATWSAYNPGPTQTVAAIDAATVIADPLNTCRFPFPPLDIPDEDATGLTDMMTANAAGTIADLDLYVEVSHSWVGDLKVTLEHVASGITQTLVDRAGVPASTFGCGTDNMRAILDDEAENAIEDACNPNPAALAGRFVAGDPSDDELLSAFDGQELSGQWRLRVSDNSEGDVGVLTGWCLLPTLAEPDIEVSPDELNVMQVPDSVVRYRLAINNVGAAPLQWTIDESRVQITAVPVTPSNLQPPTTNQAALHVPQTAAADDDDAIDETAATNTPYDGPVATAPTAVLYDNGPLITIPDGGADGADVSVVQDISLGLATFGIAHQAALHNTIADDFTIDDARGWYIDDITFFAYQSGSPLESPITAVNYRVWDGPPNDPNSDIVYGESFANQLLETTWSGIYRAAENDLSATNRPIMQNKAQGDFVLPPGTYWVEWQSDGLDSFSGPWAPPVTISGVVTTGNALQFFGGNWTTVRDSATDATQDLPFIISGQILQAIPWAAVTPQSGANDAEVMVTLNTNNLDFGVYTASLLITSNDPDTPTVAVPITLTVDLAHAYFPFVRRK